MDYLRRTISRATAQAASYLRMDFATTPRNLMLADFRNPSVTSTWLRGCDKDIGGFSTIAFETHPSLQYATWKGYLSFDLPPDLGNPLLGRSPEKSGYAAIKSTVPPYAGFRRDTWDLSRYRFLSFRVRERSTPSEHDRPHELMINIKAESFVPGGLYQYPFRLPKFDTWYTIFIPFRAFVLTDRGFVLENQSELNRFRVLSLGMSLIYGPEGDYWIDLDWFRAVNPPGESEEELERKYLNDQDFFGTKVDTEGILYGQGCDSARQFVRVIEDEGAELIEARERPCQLVTGHPPSTAGASR